VLEGDHKRKIVVIPVKYLLNQMGSWKSGEKFTRLVFNLIVKRKSRYYDNPLKKLSFPRSLSSTWSGNENPGGAFTKLAFNVIRKRKSRYYDNPLKKLSFPRMRESRETLTLNSYLLHQGAKSVFCD